MAPGLPAVADTLRGAIALVTGGGRRVGRGIAMELAARGCDVVVHFGRSREAAEQTVAELVASYGVRSWALRADLASPQAIGELMAQVATICQRLDLLVNSAATFLEAPLTATDAEHWDRVQAINLRAPHLLIKAGHELLATTAEQRQTTSAVVNIADLSGVVAWRDFGAHGVSKAGLLQLTRSAALELAPLIRVNAVVPGAILPPAGQSADSAAWQAVGERLPLGRPGQPSDVGQAVAFLASAPFVTGTLLFVDGGEHLVGSNKR